ncbi:protein kinase, putative [Trypanosoma vivax Y486]|uniref:Protein kinase, putative n=1 Tax=Trypanosoma vivax (strain Y486) TaxID=1055687 RepID=F9WR20_TRYVY|nr:protein kinase, putative [Trypanosoma vivax Y486]|eukprot:CCD20004.1 protein kinase, putative [Trypanosoma vivax Y486]
MSWQDTFADGSGLQSRVMRLVEKVDNEAVLEAVLRLLENKETPLSTNADRREAQLFTVSDVCQSATYTGTSCPTPETRQISNDESLSFLDEAIIGTFEPVLFMPQMCCGIDALKSDEDGAKIADTSVVHSTGNPSGMRAALRSKEKLFNIQSDGGRRGDSELMSRVLSDQLRERYMTARSPTKEASAGQTHTPSVLEKESHEECAVRAAVSVCHLFSHFDHTVQAEIARTLRREVYRAGTNILTQGSASPQKLFLVTRGMCEVVVGGRVVRMQRVGTVFGGLEVVYGRPDNAATVRCVTDCTLYTLDQSACQRIIRDAVLENQKRYQPILSRIPFFDPLGECSRTLMAEALLPQAYNKGDYVNRANDPGEWVYIITEGEATAMVKAQGEEVEPRRLAEGDVFGELEFLFGHRIVADVFVSSPRLQTLRVKYEHFDWIVGTARDRLKEYVATCDLYAHYRHWASGHLKDELNLLAKPRESLAKSMSCRSLTLREVCSVGEILEPLEMRSVCGEDVQIPDALGEAIDASDNRFGAVFPLNEKAQATPMSSHMLSASSSHMMFRYPLRPPEMNNVAVVGLREDGRIVLWNEAMVCATGCAGADTVGRHISSLLADCTGQERMSSALLEARRYSGDVESFFKRYPGGLCFSYNFTCVNGLTQTRIKLSILPPVTPQKGEGAEVLLAVGVEGRSDRQNPVDKSEFLIHQVSSILRNTDGSDQDRVEQVVSLLSSFEKTYRAMGALTADVCAVNIRELVGSVVTEFDAQFVAAGASVQLCFHELDTENVYLNVGLLSECLRYGLKNSLRNNDRVKVAVTVRVTRDNNMEFLTFEFQDDGACLPAELVEGFQRGTLPVGYPQARRVQAVVEKQGGVVSLHSIGSDTRLLFTFPFVPLLNAAKAPALFSCAESCDPPKPSSGSGALLDPNGCETFVTLVVESTPAQRSVLCSVLWERKHAVLTARTVDEVKQLIRISNIIFIDPHQYALGERDFDPELVQLLSENARRVVVVLTSACLDEEQIRANKMGEHAVLRKPFTSIQALQCVLRSENASRQFKVETWSATRVRETLYMSNRGPWRRGRHLGKGMFGSVYEATEVLTGGKMAVKEMCLGKDDSRIEQFVREVSTMYSLQHPNIIHYFYCETSVEENVFRVFMECATGGSVQNLLKEKGKLEFKQYQSLLRDIVEGVAYIHSMRYVHGDIKTSNVLLSADGRAKIGDFGSARRVNMGELLYDMQGSPLYMSPECMSVNCTDEDGAAIGYSFPSDVWSLGCVALEMATNRPPFSHLENIKGPVGLMKYITGIRNTPELSLLFDEPPCITEFVAACLNPDPSKRPTAAQLLNFTIFCGTSQEEDRSAPEALGCAMNTYVAFQNGPGSVQQGAKLCFYPHGHDENSSAPITQMETHNEAGTHGVRGNVSTSGGTDDTSRLEQRNELPVHLHGNPCAQMECGVCTFTKKEEFERPCEVQLPQQRRPKNIEKRMTRCLSVSESIFCASTSSSASPCGSVVSRRSGSRNTSIKSLESDAAEKTTTHAAVSATANKDAVASTECGRQPLVTTTDILNTVLPVFETGAVRHVAAEDKWLHVEPGSTTMPRTARHRRPQELVLSQNRNMGFLLTFPLKNACEDAGAERLSAYSVPGGQECVLENQNASSTENWQSPACDVGEETTVLVLDACTRQCTPMSKGDNGDYSPYQCHVASDASCSRLAFRLFVDEGYSKTTPAAELKTIKGFSCPCDTGHSGTVKATEFLNHIRKRRVRSLFASAGWTKYRWRRVGNKEAQVQGDKKRERGGCDGSGSYLKV